MNIMYLWFPVIVLDGLPHLIAVMGRGDANLWLYGEAQLLDINDFKTVW